MSEMKPNYQVPVLLIDDDAMVRDVIEGYLKSFGFQKINPSATPSSP